MRKKDAQSLAVHMNCAKYFSFIFYFSISKVNIVIKKMANKRQTTKTKVRTHAVRRVKAASTYDVDIGQEFKDIKSAI